jgi:hypothetical protein
MSLTIAPRFVGIPQFEKCIGGARMTPSGFDSDGDLVVDELNDLEAIAAIQRALRDLGYPLLVSFNYDDSTVANVRQFKINEQLQVPPGLVQHDGVTGPGTSARLNELFTPPPQPSPPPIPVPAPLALQAWQRLISFRPPEKMQADLNARFNLLGLSRVVHAVEDANGPINLDFYPVRVSAMPIDGNLTMSAEQLLEFVRSNMDMFVDNTPEGCKFHPYDEAIDAAAWLPIALPGAVVSIDMFTSKLGTSVNVDSGSVVAAEVAPNHWIFSTLWTPSDGGHPVSGNREFGFVSGVAGEFVFYTRGADRTTSIFDNLLAATVFGSANNLWLSFQRRLAAFVNSKGGLATIEQATSNRYDWPTVQGTYHRPSTNWV